MQSAIAVAMITRGSIVQPIMASMDRSTFEQSEDTALLSCPFVTVTLA
jgi:hypothetical protein